MAHASSAFALYDVIIKGVFHQRRLVWKDPQKRMVFGCDRYLKPPVFADKLLIGITSGKSLIVNNEAECILESQSNCKCQCNK